MELSFLHAIQAIHMPWLDSVMIFVSALGNAGFIWILTAVVLLFRKKTRHCGLLMLAVMAVCLVVGNLGIKNLVARERPFVADPTVILKIPLPGEYSFPSGHTMHSFAAATVLFLHFKKPGIMALFLAALIAFSRMYLFVHYPTDILGGMVIGITAAVLLCRLFPPQKHFQGVQRQET